MLVLNDMLLITYGKKINSSRPLLDMATSDTTPSVSTLLYCILFPNSCPSPKRLQRPTAQGQCHRSSGRSEVWPFIASNGGLFPPNEVCRLAQPAPLAKPIRVCHRSVCSKIGIWDPKIRSLPTLDHSAGLDQKFYWSNGPPEASWGFS